MKKDAILITGGAGYIGSHTVRMMADEGFHIVVLDNLVYGHREAILSEDVRLIEGNVGDRALVESIFDAYAIQGVIHFAAYAYVGESVEKPGKYYANNTAEPLVLLDVMRERNCDRFIFSSTCATYGNPRYMPIDEKHPQDPINPYGRSKRMVEMILEDYDRAYGLRSVALRYFNACGASPDARIGEDHDPETHLIPRLLMTLTGELDKMTVFGTDYETPDGTCIRDYIHIVDLARAHVLALKYLEDGNPSLRCNLGTGNGASVKEIIEKTEQVTGKKAPVEYGERRRGDPPELVADPSLAREILGWEAEFKDVADSIETSWKWVSQPHGGRYANF